MLCMLRLHCVQMWPYWDVEVLFLCNDLQNAHFPLILTHSTKNCTKIHKGGSKTGWCFASSTLYFQVNTCLNPVCVSSSFAWLLLIDFIWRCHPESKQLPDFQEAELAFACNSNLSEITGRVFVTWWPLFLLFNNVFDSSFNKLFFHQMSLKWVH